MNARPTFLELSAFLTIARHGSFRAAADELGLSPSTLSHMTRSLEERLALRLFNRTTRSVALTEAGIRFAGKLGPVLGGLDEALEDVQLLQAQPRGTVRINAAVDPSYDLMQRVLPVFMARFPEVHVELVAENRFVDIVGEGFDAGVRLAESLPPDMIAIPFGGDERMVVAAAPAYVARHGRPATPDDLANHACIRFRKSGGRRYHWEFERHGQEQQIDVAGPITVNDMTLALQGALGGLGVAFLTLGSARAALDSGDLILLLEEFTPPFPGYCFYYPSRRLIPAPLRAFIDVLREAG